MAIDWEEARHHMVATVEGSEVKLDPFPYLIAEPFFPDPVYEELLRRWPGRDRGYGTTNWSTRLELRWSQFRQSATGEELAFWQGVNDLCGAANEAIRRSLAPHFAAKYEPYVGAGWADHVGEVEFVDTAFQLTVYTGAYDLPPHVDNLLLVTNAFVYCSERDEPEPAYGTVLYRSKGLMIPTNWTLRGSQIAPFLDRVTVAPYARNSCFAYVNGPRSFHAVDQHDIGERERRLLMFGSRMYVREAHRIFGEEIGALSLRKKN